MKRRALLVCLLALVATVIVVKKKVFGLSVSREDPARYVGTRAMADRLHEVSTTLDPNRIWSEEVPIYAPLVRYFAGIKNPPDDRSRVLLDAQEAEKALQRGDTKQAIDGFQKVRAA